MFEVAYRNGNAYVTLSDCIDLGQTLDCGQAFRWERDTAGHWQGTAFHKTLTLAQTDLHSLIFYHTDKTDFETIWQNYFDLERDYSDIIEKISGNETLKTAALYGKGIRILNQDPWETLCSFILSQNNNIKRIKGIISRLCESFGERLPSGGYAFPGPEKLAGLSPDSLAVLRAGFRTKYLLDAAQKIASGEINLAAVRSLPLDRARDSLMQIHGVGPKVADCALLFSMGQIAAFPKDVWINRALSVLFDGRLPDEAVPFAGIIQQYIFYYARETKLHLS